MLDKLRLKIAIQKSGRLSKESKKLFQKSGIKVNFQENHLFTFAENMPIDIVHVRDDDIPRLIMDGMIDLGIIGENVLQEELLLRKSRGIKCLYKIIQRLNFGVCRLSIAIPTDEVWNGIHWLNNKRIATSYPHILKKYLSRFKINFYICTLSGSVEIAPKVGLADAVFDIVSTGETLQNHGLQEVNVVCHSKPCLIQKVGNFSIYKKSLLNTLIFRIKSVIQAEELKYIMMHVPKSNLKKIINILPESEKPTIVSLFGVEEKVVLHMVILEIFFWEIIENLKNLGATSILVLSIEKIMK